MPARLSTDQATQFERDGYVAPIRVMTPGAAADLLARLEQLEADLGGPLLGDRRQKPHLFVSWMADLVRDPAIVEAVADLFGPDLLCWSATLFVKEPRNPAYVSWHQDATYWGLSSPDVVTAWVALTPSTVANGALEVIPGSHLLDQLPHRDTFAADNLLSRGQEIAVDVDRAAAVTLELDPGEMSLHHVRLVHGSAPNPSDHRRVGFAIRYLPTSVAPVGGGADSATLVHGVDRFGHFEHEPRPMADLDPGAMALHAQVMARQAKVLLQGALIDTFRA